MDGHLNRYSLSIYWNLNKDLHLTIKIYGYGALNHNITEMLDIFKEIFIEETGLIAEKVTIRLIHQGTDAGRLQEIFESRYGICPIIALDWKFIRA